jgi:uncharacterized protein YvpB
MILKVPYYSQKLDVSNNDWKNKACGITSLKMLLDFFSVKQAPSIDELIKELEFVGERIREGVTHETIVILLRNHGINAYRQEFKSHEINIKNGKVESNRYEKKLIDSGINKIVENLINELPVIISAVKKFKEKDKPHLVLIIGFEKDENSVKGFYYNDPDSNIVDGGKNLFVDLKTFKEHWRKMAIFVYK